MCAVGAFVSKVAVDFEYAIDAADNGALQKEFWRDAQKQFGVESVAVRFERTSRSAAVNGLQHRCFDFEIVVVRERAAQRLHYL